MERSHLRAILPVIVAALLACGCMPSSDGPSIPRWSTDDASITGSAESNVPAATQKKSASRRPAQSLSTPRARPPETQ
jgi:hypothetical protein